MKLFVGTYSNPLAGMEGNGEGIYSVAFDCDTGEFGFPQLLAKCVNPSSLAFDPVERTLFTGREVFGGDDPALRTFRLASSGELCEISRQALDGELPCHLAYDPVTRRLASAQYWTGDVALFNIVAGEIQVPVTSLTRRGRGPNAARQEGPHAHCVAFSDQGKVLHLVDLGTDSLVSHRLAEDNHPTETATLALPPGCGPRHMALNKTATRAFVFCELDESLIVLTRSGIGWKIDSVQAGFAMAEGEEGAGAAIRLAPDQRHLYISGRRQSQIACFHVGDTLERIGETDCGGLSPREFIISSDGAWLIVANQNSNTLTSFRRDLDTGQLHNSGNSCSIGSPVALVEYINTL